MCYNSVSDDESQPSFEMLKIMASYFGVTTDYLLGATNYSESDWNSKLPELSSKDERDIAVDIEKFINNLDSEVGYAAFDVRSMDEADDEDREILKASLDNSYRLAKRMAEQKFTPKKYRD